MPGTVADAMIDRISQWGVKRIYGYPGDGINGLLGALRRASHEIRFVQSRHEELAAFMACAHAKFTGEVGVCMATSGPGAIHLLNGLYDAKKDHTPVVAIVGQSATYALGSDFQQEVDLMSLFKDVAGAYVNMVVHDAAWRQQVDNAFRIAIAERTVTCVIVPLDIQEHEAQDPQRKHGANFSGVGYAFPRIVPTPAQLHDAADILNQGERVAILIGAGAIGAAREVLETAELLGAGVAKALLGKAAVPDTHPLVTGSIGLLGTEPSDTMMRRCDTLLMVGTSFPYVEFLPKPEEVRCVQIDVLARQLNLRFPADVALHGDAALTLRALLPLLLPKSDNSWTSEIRQHIAHWWRTLEAKAMTGANPINPQRVVWEASQRMPDNAIITCDSGSSACWFARDLVIRDNMMASLSGGLATMCPGVPYALAAKFAFPDRVSVAFVGDGAMQMLGMNSAISVSGYWQEWTDPRLIICVLNKIVFVHVGPDGNIVTWEQRALVGDPKFEASQRLPDFPYAEYGRQLGLGGIRVDRPDDIGPAWEEAFRADRPTILEFVTDPDVPMMPPHITFEQARAYASSIVKGDPDRWGILKATAKDAASGLLTPWREDGREVRPMPAGSRVTSSYSSIAPAIQPIQATPIKPRSRGTALTSTPAPTPDPEIS